VVAFFLRKGMHGALLDLWLLGYADEMYMSHGSTFGYVAHGTEGNRTPFEPPF
jgi:hypothetical protein